MIAGGEISARPADDAHAQVFCSCDHVFPETVRIGLRGSRIIDPAVYTTAKMFREIAIKQGIDRSDAAVNIDLDGSL